tara:strand:+ start:298 stop:1776 length:1479 start_codon:yes stop_codon:yes gene_type:complete
MDSKKLQQVHSGYSEYVYRWDYYFRSFLGAEEYRDGAYLRKYIAEDQAPGNQYSQRLLETCLQNQVKSVVDTYRSFLFRIPPTRTLGNSVNDENVQEFIYDVDLDGTTLDHFMRKVADMVTIYGGAWIGCDRPAYAVETAAQEQALGIRSYATLYSPTNVLDWQYTRQINGRHQLSMLKVVEERGDTQDTIRIWYPDRICRYVVSKDDIQVIGSGYSHSNLTATRDNPVAEYGKVLSEEEFNNPLGYIPFHHVYETESYHKGIGTSDIGDVADIQRYNYQLISEAMSNIRISSHPSIVAQPDAELNGGVGAIIYVDENTQVNPYLLQPSGASIESILKVLQQNNDAIDSITHLAAVRAKTNVPVSGVSLQVQRQNLNNKLAMKASVLQQAERQLWQDFFNWQGVEQPEDFEVYYEKHFDMTDKHSDLELYRKAIEAVPHDSFVHHMHDQIAKMMVDDEEDLAMILDSIAENHKAMNIETPSTMTSTMEDDNQ